MCWVSTASRGDLILEDHCSLIVQSVSPLVTPASESSLKSGIIAGRPTSSRISKAERGKEVSTA